MSDKAIDLEVKRRISEMKREYQEELLEAEEYVAAMKQHVLDLISEGEPEEAAMVALGWAEGMARDLNENFRQSRGAWIDSVSRIKDNAQLQLKILRKAEARKAEAELAEIAGVPH
jgi:hypothetical protein